MSARDVRPLLIGPKNSQDMTGAPWRFWTAHAAELGLPIITIGAKRFIPAGSLLAVVERLKKATTPVVELSEEDELARARAYIAGAGRR